ncbi:hypothetical protein CCP2SC5_160004 [Azospirillaceae bacterium]
MTMSSSLRGTARAMTYLHGVGGRLIGAQMLIVALAMSGFAIAVVSFDQLARVLSGITDQRVPVMTAALTLARDGERLNVSARAVVAHQPSNASKNSRPSPAR